LYVFLKSPLVKYEISLISLDLVCAETESILEASIRELIAWGDFIFWHITTESKWSKDYSSHTLSENNKPCLLDLKSISRISTTYWRRYVSWKISSHIQKWRRFTRRLSNTWFSGTSKIYNRSFKKILLKIVPILCTIILELALNPRGRIAARTSSRFSTF